MSQEEEDNVIKIGELLVRAGLLNTSDVLESIQVSKRLQIPIGRVLIMSGTVTEQLLQAALQAQMLLKEHLVSLDAACDALRLSVLDRKSLQQAFQTLNITPGYNQDISEHLVELLIDSNIVSQEQLDQAKITSSEADIPLSGALVLQGVLSANFFPTILRAQEQIQSGSVSRESAVSELKASFLLWLRAEESLKGSAESALHRVEEIIDNEFEFDFVPPLAEVDAAASVASSSATARAKAAAELEATPAPQLLKPTQPSQATQDSQSFQPAQNSQPTQKSQASQQFEPSHQSQPSSQSAPSAQPQAPAQSASAQSQSSPDSQPASSSNTAQQSPPHAPHSAADSSRSQDRLVDLVKDAGLFGQNEVQKAYEQMLEDPILSSRIFQAMRLLDEPTLHFACRCRSLVQKGLLTREEAVTALRNARSGFMTFDEALGEHASKEQPYLETRWRQRTIRAVSGGIIGALVAAVLLRGFKKR